MPKLGLGLSLPQTRVAGGSSNPQIIITGATGIYSGVNGTYTGSDGYYEIAGGAFYIDGNTLWESSYGVEIATNDNNYEGAWTPSQYFSTVELTGSGDSQADGVYTRADSQIDMRFVTFLKSGGSITWDFDNGWWYTTDDLYRNYYEAFDGAWETENGEEPVPSASYSTSNRNTGPITS